MEGSLNPEKQQTIGCTGFVAGSSIQRKLARTVLAAGVERYFPRQFGVDYDVIGWGNAQDLFDEQLDVGDFCACRSGPSGSLSPPGYLRASCLSCRSASCTWSKIRCTLWEAGKRCHRDDARRRRNADSGDCCHPTQNCKSGGLHGRRYRNLRGSSRHPGSGSPAAGAQGGMDGRPFARGAGTRPEDSLRKYRVVFAEGKGVAWPMEQTFNAARQISVVGVEHRVRENLRVKPARERSVLK